MGVTKIVAFDNAPYPFPATERVPGETRPFFEQEEDGRLFHMAPRGGKLFERGTYDDNRSLLSIPATFDPDKPDAMLVVFFHGNLATLCDVEGRQAIPRQVAASGANAILVAPQLAVNALDSSPGRFYEPDFFEKYVAEAADHLSALSPKRLSSTRIEALPIVLVAYSGGYLATAFSLHYALARSDRRIAGVILLDALFGESKKFEDWIVATRPRSFFVSAYSNASAGLNRELESALASDGLPVCPSLPDAIPRRSIGPGVVAFKPVIGANHNDFTTQAWTRDPLAKLLAGLTLDEGTRCHAGPP